jgi:hypothetical protein
MALPTILGFCNNAVFISCTATCCFLIKRSRFFNNAPKNNYVFLYYNINKHKCYNVLINEIVFTYI